MVWNTASEGCIITRAIRSSADGQPPDRECDGLHVGYEPGEPNSTKNITRNTGLLNNTALKVYQKDLLSYGGENKPQTNKHAW